MKGKCELNEWNMLAYSSDANLNPAIAVSNDVEFKPFVTAELGLTFQAVVERTELLSEFTKATVSSSTDP